MENKEKDKNQTTEEELSLDELSEVTGGSGLRHVKKEQTHDITESIKQRI